MVEKEKTSHITTHNSEEYLGPFELGKVQHADCLDALKLLPDISIDMIFIDPPYGHNNNNNDLISRWELVLGRGDYIPERDNRPIINDGVEANEVFKLALVEFKRLLKPGGVCCCCCGGGGGPDLQFARWSMWINEKLNFKQMIIWDKGKMGMGWHYRRSYETVLISQQPGAACKWYDESHTVENIIRPGDYGIRKIIPNREQHPTEKPVKLPAHFIRLHTEPGDVVLDCFAGHGGTGVACTQLERRFLGFEIDADHCRIANDRIAAATRGQNLMQYRQGQEIFDFGDP